MGWFTDYLYGGRDYAERMEANREFEKEKIEKIARFKAPSKTPPPQSNAARCSCGGEIIAIHLGNGGGYCKCKSCDKRH